MIELAHRAFGDTSNPPMLLLHGLFGSSSNWGTIARQLADRYQVIVPDLRNHGQSPHDHVHNYPAMVDDVVALMDRLGLGPAVMAGHSMGGKVVMQLALSAPERVAGLVVVDMAPISYSHNFNLVLQAFDAVDPGSVRNRADADVAMAALVPEPGVRAFLLQNLVKRPDGWGWRQNLAALRREQADILAFPHHPDADAYNGPTTFIHGELSDYVKPSYEAEIARLFPRATLCSVAGAGHWVYAERPDGFMACLEAFLADLP
ncbi:MAG: alpha/beta fold hydrolase [Gammaproteobacteria bacterium]|nr:alpha/beta fold hydrolase [Gammaproteobacteria bacterium]